MPNSKQIVYLSQAQYAELIANGNITVDGVTVTYDENDIYVTPQAEPVTDVRVAGTSVAANGVANVPVASVGKAGAFYTTDNGFYLGSGTQVQLNRPTDGTYKTGADEYRVMRISQQHLSTFYGLAKAAGHDEASSTEPLGTYTPEAKGAIQSMLGVSDLIATEENNLIASKAYKVGDVFTANGKLYKATAAIAADGAIITDGANANCEETSVGEGFVKFTDIASTSVPGAVMVDADYGTEIANKRIKIVKAAADQVKLGTHVSRPITPYSQHESTFYGLSKAAGVDLANETVTVGTYPETSKAAIRTMLGATSSNVIAVQDTQPTDTDTKIWLPETAPEGVEVPTMEDLGDYVKKTDLATTTTVGIVKANSFGIKVNNTGELYISKADITSEVKPGVANYLPIVPSNQHAAAFYGLAKAAGDTTQSASSNAVGSYTDNAKASIKAMLGIQDGSTGTVDVSGTTPTITAVENTRYVCGEVTSLNFTPPASGISIVRFTSGSTVAVLTIPNTVKFPEWFDPTSLETNTIYEICVTDGVYGAVMSWAL